MLSYAKRLLACVMSNGVCIVSAANACIAVNAYLKTCKPLKFSIPQQATACESVCEGKTGKPDSIRLLEAHINGRIHTC